MIYHSFQDKQLSALGFGTMRLPLLADGVTIDEAQLQDMVRCAMENGVNYFDTAVPYHLGTSEIAIGRALARYPRDSWYLADKFPGHQIAETYDPAATFEEQLKKCGVDYFDFYLLHNVYENSIHTYMDPQWGILDYFVEQKRLGRIKHLGFSTHGSVAVMEKFLDYCGEHMEFCQIQLNYLDWTLQDAKGKCELLAKWNIPVWVMEPVRGGKLATLPADSETALKAMRPDESIPAWCFRWLQGIENVTMVLSGMSNMAQMVDNVKTFEAPAPLTDAENAAVMAAAESLKNSVPCTACRYCCDGCPMELDIPFLLSVYNDIRFAPVTNTAMRIDSLPNEKKPTACIGCGKCAQICPQKIDIPGALQDFSARLEKITPWAEICRQREAAQSV